jgi:hypothetical protein
MLNQCIARVTQLQGTMEIINVVNVNRKPVNNFRNALIPGRIEDGTFKVIGPDCTKCQLYILRRKVASPYLDMDESLSWHEI